MEIQDLVYRCGSDAEFLPPPTPILNSSSAARSSVGTASINRRDDEDNQSDGIDSLFMLPLRIVPFKTEGLTRSRLIKNNHLVGVIELYSEKETGSGQVAIYDLPIHFQWAEGASHPDLRIVEMLAALPSYDVYSLRRSLRDCGIPVNSHSDLKLSEKKNRELAGYMRQFTLPLIRQIYGDSSSEIRRFEDLLALFTEPDVARARLRLQQMASKLEISINEIPRFIENYADIFMSLSYYTHCLDRLTPLLQAFIHAMKDMRKNFQVRANQPLMKEMERIERSIDGLVAFLKQTFQDFQTMSQDMWRNLSAAKFEEVKTYIENAQAKVGGVLCGLTVKMNAWVIRYPNPMSGSPGAKGEFIMTDMRPGFAELIAIARGKEARTSRLTADVPVLTYASQTASTVH